MAFINWDDTYVLNVLEMDIQHKELADLVNDIYCRVKDDDIDYVCNKATPQLIEKIKHHFDTEENIMIQVKYPEIEEHKKVHADLVEQIKIKAGKLRVELLFDSLEVFAFLRAWLNDHLLEEDSKLAEYLHKTEKKYDVSNIL